MNNPKPLFVPSKRTFNLRHWLTGAFSKHLPHKLIALAVAVLVWGGIQNVIDRKGYVEGVELRVIPPPGYMLLSETLPEIGLDIRGNEKNISRYTPHDFSIEYTVSGAEVQGTADALSIQLRPEYVQAPRGITVVGVTPSSIRVRVDRQVTREKTVRVILSGELTDGYQGIGSAIPSVIPVTGPESVLRRLSYIPTAPIPLDKTMTETFFVTNHPLEMPMGNLSCDVSGIEATVNIQHLAVQRTIPDLPVDFLVPESMTGYRIVHAVNEKAVVRFSGKQTALNLLAPSYIRIFADVSELPKNPESGIYSVSLRCWCADPMVKIESVDPRKVSVKVIAPDSSWIR